MWSTQPALKMIFNNVCWGYGGRILKPTTHMHPAREQEWVEL